MCGRGWGHVWQGGHAWWGACVAGVHCGGCMWQGEGHAWQEEGACMAGGMCVWGGAWQGGMHGRGPVWQGGMCGRGALWGVCVAGEGACMAGGGGMHRRGHVCGGVHGKGACMAGGLCGREAYVAGETAIAVGGAHPTGMHSCLLMVNFKEIKFHVLLSQYFSQYRGSKVSLMNLCFLLHIHQH